MLSGVLSGVSLGVLLVVLVVLLLFLLPSMPWVRSLPELGVLVLTSTYPSPFTRPRRYDVFLFLFNGERRPAHNEGFVRAIRYLS